MPEIKRQTAHKCTINQILSGNYVQKTGWEPNFIEIGTQQISRVNIIATIISKEDNAFLIDDGTGQISITLFNEIPGSAQTKIGDVVLIIGRPREYNSQKYIAPEIIRKIEDKRWIEYRKKELATQTTTHSLPNSNHRTPTADNRLSSADSRMQSSDHRPQTTDSRLLTTDIRTLTSDHRPRSADHNILTSDDSLQKYEETPINNYAHKLITLIKKLDAGSGADINEVIKQSKIKDAEKYITTLLNEGEIFEIRAGKLKVLE